MNKRSPISSSLVVPLRGPNPFPALEQPNPIQIGNVICTFSWPPLDTVYFQRLSLKLKDVRGPLIFVLQRDIGCRRRIGSERRRLWAFPFMRGSPPWFVWHGIFA